MLITNHYTQIWKPNTKIKSTNYKEDFSRTRNWSKLNPWNLNWKSIVIEYWVRMLFLTFFSKLCSAMKKKLKRINFHDIFKIWLNSHFTKIPTVKSKKIAKKKKQTNKSWKNIAKKIEKTCYKMFFQTFALPSSDSSTFYLSWPGKPPSLSLR